jgi:acetoin utilization protein AcuB
MTRQPHTVEVDQPLSAAWRVMCDSGAAHLPVLQAGELVGVISARDIEVATLADVVDDEEVPVRELMDETPFIATPDMSLAAVARRMADEAHACCVVVERGHIVGLLSSTDALAALLGPTRHGS